MEEENFMKLFDEITKIRQILEILSRDALKKELEEIATTPERKKMWILLNGLLSTEEIAQRVGVTSRAVQIFIKELVERDLVEIEKRGYPKRKFDYIPSDWKIQLE